MAYLGKADILAAQDLQYEDVAVPEWGGTVRVRGLTGRERDAFEAAVASARGKDVKLNLQNVRARLAALSVVDADGARVFDERDINALGDKSAQALERVFQAAMRLSGLTPGDVKDLTENLDEGQSEDSISA
jgi:hypothetical protein